MCDWHRWRWTWGEVIRVAGFGGLLVIVAKADTTDALKQLVRDI